MFRFSQQAAAASVCLTACLFSYAPASQAAISVVGGGYARDCYIGVRDSEPQRATLDSCNMALEQENLRRHDRAATYVNRGILHMRASRFTEALADYQRSLEIEADLPGAHVNLGAAYYGLKNYPKALEELNIGLESTDSDVRAVGYYNRALTREHLGDLNGAYQDLLTVIEIDPEFELAHKQIARFEVVPAHSLK